MDAGAGDTDRRGDFAQAGAATQRLVLPGTVQAWYEAPIYARVPRILERLVLRLRRAREKGRRPRRDRNPGHRRPIGRLRKPSSTQRERWSRSERPRSSSPSRPTNAGGTRPRASSRCRSRRASRPTTTAPWPGSTPPKRKSPSIKAKSIGCKRWKTSRSIIAPFDGVVTARETDIGALINAGSGTGRQRTRALSRGRHPPDADLRPGAAATVGGHSSRAHRRTALAAISRQDIQGDSRHDIERHQ